MDERDGTDPSNLGDLSLLAAARSGSPDAATELHRRFEPALRTVAAGYRGHDSDRDQLLDRVVAGLPAAPMPTTEGGVAITLFALVRSLKIDRSAPSGPPTGLVDLVPGRISPTLGSGPESQRRNALLWAFGSLDDRDKVLLWFSAVEGTMPKALSGRLSIGGADMASTKTFRARSHLRQAYVDRRMTDGGSATCADFAAALVERADGEGTDDQAALEAHLGSCARCTALLAELPALTSDLMAEAASVLAGIDLAMLLGGGIEPVPLERTPAPVKASPSDLTAVAAVTTGAAITRDFEDELDGPDGPDGPDDERDRPRGRALAVTGVGLLVAAAIAAFVLWGRGGGSGGQQVAVAPSTTVRFQHAPVTSARTTVSHKATTTAPTTTRPKATTTTKRRGDTTPSRRSGGNTWTPPATVGGTAPAATSPSASTPPPTSPPTTAAPATTTTVATPPSTDPPPDPTTTVTP